MTTRTESFFIIAFTVISFILLMIICAGCAIGVSTFLVPKLLGVVSVLDIFAIAICSPVIIWVMYKGLLAITDVFLKLFENFFDRK